jgi:hypothetical protein
VVRAVHKFSFGLVVNETPNKARPVGKRLFSDKGLMSLTGSVCFPPDRRRECQGTLSMLCRSTAFS